MPVYKWRRRATKHFGEVWFPYAELELRTADGTYQSIAIQVDSGATVSLLRRSVADLLGIKLNAGRRIDLSGVGEAQVIAFVHQLPIRLDDQWPELQIPFAIAEVENVPNLLGRLGLFDNLQVDFDPSLRETRLTARWLDDGDRTLWEWIIETEEHIFASWEDLPWSLTVREAVRRMIGRTSLLSASMAGLAKLQRTKAGPLFIRAIFELAVQLFYLMRDRDTRAKDYLDFEHVTRKTEMDTALSGPKGEYSDLIRNSPLRPTGEKRVDAEFDRVKDRFANKKGNPHKTWYCKQFKQVVDALPSTPYDWQADYAIWYAKYSGWAHGDPFSTSQDGQKPSLLPREWLMQCYTFYARMLLLVADEGKIILTAEQDQGLRNLARGLLRV
ncbi:MAG: hypothetical protein AMXMBFR20_05810 [Planctomycetia bacterium]